MNGDALARGFSKGSLEKNPLLSQWIGLHVPGIVVLRVGKVEFGQGIATALAQIAAEELDVDLGRVRFADVRTDTSPDEGVTSGSLSVQHSGDALRWVCASVRVLAIAAYCDRFDVPPTSVTVDNGALVSSATHRHSSYWDLSLDAALAQGISSSAEPKRRAEYTTVGRSALRRDLSAKVFGRPSYIQDLVLERMMHGRVVRMPNRAAKLIDLDARAFHARCPGVLLVRDGCFLGVLTESEEACVAAASVLAHLARWELPDSLPDWSNLAQFLTGARAQQRLVDRRSDAEDRSAIFQLAATYSRPYIAHASIGPSCALARWQDDGVDVWSHSQGIFNLRADIEVYLKRDWPSAASKVVVHHVEGAGCYGHNPADDVAFDAVLLSRHAGGRPVRVLWSRADELSCGPNGPAHLVQLSATLDAAGRVCTWNHAIWSNGYTCRPGRAEPGSLSFLGASEIERPFDAPVSLDPPMSAGGGSDRNAIPGYDFANHEVVTNRLLDMPIRTSAIRALGGYGNVWAIESFMDELAHAAGKSPLAFRLAHLSDPRALRVIERAISAAPWWQDTATDKEGVGRGLAYARYKDTGAWCAVAVRIQAAEAIRVLDISIAADLGLVINPDGAANQLEGGALQSCSWTLKEELRFSTQAITTRSWEDYPILTFSEAPSVTVSLIAQPDEPPLGAGEAAQGPTAAAIGNALFDALGVRVRQLPLTPDRIVAAMPSN